MYRILLFRPAYSRAEALMLMTDELHRGLLELGHDCELLDMGSGYFKNDLATAIQKHVDFILFLGPVTVYDFLYNGVPLTNELQIPVITYLADPPYIHIDRFEVQLYHHIILYLNKVQAVNFTKWCLPNYKAKVNCFVPHAGISNNLPFTEEQFYKRSNRILFVASYPREVGKKPWDNSEDELTPKYWRNFMEDVYCCLDENTGIDEAIMYMINERGLSFEESMQSDFISHTFRKVWNYFYAVTRIKTFDFLVDNGHEIDLYGVGWPESVKNYSNVAFKGEINYLDNINLLSSYKLSVNPVQQAHASHERVLNALANGCQSLLYKGTYFAETFDGYKGLHYIPTKGDIPDSVNVEIKKAINEMPFKEIQRTRQYVLENHMWLNRAEQIIDIFNLSNLKVVYY